MILGLKKVKGINGLVPCDEETVKLYNKMDYEEEINPDYKPRRNMKFHRKYWALLNAVIINQEHYKTVDNLHEAIKFKGGYYETVIPLDASPFLVTKSIAFHSMDAQEFEDFYSVALDECLKLVGEDAINDIIKFI